MNYKNKIRSVSSFLIVLTFFPNIAAQNLDIRKNSFYFPHNIGSIKYLHTAGIKSANLPEDIVESDDNFRAPLIFYDFKFGLLNEFSFDGGIETNFITVQFKLGPKWSHELGKFTFSLGGNAAYYAGALNQFDFKTQIYGWLVYPNLTIGYEFPRFSVSLESELILAIDQTSKTGDVEVANNVKTLSGFSVTAYIEQPLWKDNFLVIGLKANFTKFYYPIWASFSTFDRLYFIPEVIFSFNL